MLKKLKPKSEFSRNVLTLMSGTAIAQAIPIAISPILTRLYSPENFGFLALYMSVALLLAVIVTGRYEMAIILPKKDSDSLNILALSIFITFFISSLSLIIIIIFNDKITSLLGTPKISNWLYLIPITVFLTGIYQSLNYWNSRHGNYNIIAKSNVYKSLTTGTSNITIAYAIYSVGGLIIGNFTGQLVSTVYVVKNFWIKDKNILQQINIIKMIALAKRYKKFPLINSFHAFVNILKDNVVNIFIAIAYTQSTLGYYYFMLKIMRLPVGILGSSLAQVFYKEASKEYNKTQNIKILVVSLIKKLLLISVIPITLLYVYAEDLFRIIFGEEWSIAGVYAKAIAPYILFHFIASPLGMVALIVNKQEKAFFWGLSESILFISIFMVCNKFSSDLGFTLTVLSTVMGVYFTIYFYWVYTISEKKT